MPIRLFHIGFEYGNPGFPKTDILSQHFGNPDDKVVFDIRESNVLVIGNFLRNNDIEIILGYRGPKILTLANLLANFISHKYLTNFSNAVSTIMQSDVFPIPPANG